MPPKGHTPQRHAGHNARVNVVLSNFDHKTAFLIIGVFYLILPVFAWIVLARQRSLSVSLWCASGISTALGLLWIVWKETPSFGIGPFGAFLLLCSAWLRAQSLRLDLGKPWRWRTPVLGLALPMALVYYLDYGLRDAVLRAQFISLVLAALLAHVCQLAWRIGTLEKSQNAKWIGGVYGLVALALLARAYLLAGLETRPGIRLAPGIELLSFSLLLSVVIGHLGYVGMALDRSRRRELGAEIERVRVEENRRLGRQIAQLDRQRSLGLLSGTLAHELNQPLTSILTNAHVAERGLKGGNLSPEQHREFLDKIANNARRAGQIVDRVREQIRPSRRHREPVDLVATVRDVVALVHDEARRFDILLVQDLPPGQVLVSAEPIALSQIILNLVRNAIQALADTTGPRCVTLALTRAEDQVRLQVSDNGAGFDASKLATVGTPFFTTKPDGLGLGLSISRSIAEDFQGHLNFANSDAGQGAVVTLELPALPKG